MSLLCLYGLIACESPSALKHSNGEAPADTEIANQKPESGGHFNLNASKKIQFDITYDIEVAGDTQKIVLTSTIPCNYEFRQEVLEIKYSPEPDMVFSDGQNKYAKFTFSRPEDGQSVKISSRLIIYEYSLSLASSRRTENLDAAGTDLYLEPEPYIESDNPLITENEVLSMAAEDGKERIGMIYRYVMDVLNYEKYNPQSAGAVKALTERSGDCTEYTDLFVALCRAAGIPARSVEGYYLYAADRNIGHSWPEAFLDGSWIPFDPTVDDNNPDGCMPSFYDLQNAYVYLSFERNDPNLNGYHYFHYRYWGDQTDVTKTVDYRFLD